MMVSKFRSCLLVLSSLSLLLACQVPIVPTQGSQSLNSTGSRFRLQTQSTATTPNGRSLVSLSNGATYIGDVPFVSQGSDNTCGQAVMTMLLQYWGIDIDYQTVVNEGNPLNIATSYDDIQNYLRSKGLSVQAYRGGNLEVLVSQIQAGKPVMVLLDFGSLQQAHYVLVTGYNARRNTIIMHESQSGPYMELDVDSFIEMWQNTPVVKLPLFGGSNYEYLLFEVDKAST